MLDLNEVIGTSSRCCGGWSAPTSTQVSCGGRAREVRADPGQLEQVLMNLCANARDAMPEGGAEDSNRRTRSDERRGRARAPGSSRARTSLLTVGDTGPGIPRRVRAHIFEPFFTTKEQGKGTGLGLATVYGIVKQSGGGIYLDDVGGARFTIYLPSLPPGTAPNGR